MKNQDVTIVKVTHFDEKYDYYRFQYNENKEILISKSGMQCERTDTLIVPERLRDYTISVFEKGDYVGTPQVSKVEVFSLAELGHNQKEDGTKKVTFCDMAVFLLAQLGILEVRKKLNQPADFRDIQRGFQAITGKSLPEKHTQPLTLFDLICLMMDTLTISYDKEYIVESACQLGLLKNIEDDNVWFGVKTNPMQAFGLYNVEVMHNQIAFYDDMAGLFYNLLFVKEQGKPYLVHMAEKDKAFGRKVTDTYDRHLVSLYYEYVGFQIEEIDHIDQTTGEHIHSFVLPGANLNHTYYNEYTTVDHVHYIFCAAFDKQVKKGRGIPVLYNSRTKETKNLHDVCDMRCYAMLMSPKNIAYFIVGNKIYAYDVNIRGKKVVYEEPNGHELQEVPTITNDGRYLSFFYGTILSHQPNRVCVLDLETGEAKTVVNEEWVHTHFGGKVNPFAGHILINPIHHYILNFLHGGPVNVEDRMWLIDTKTLKIWEPYKQIKLENGEFAENLTHWAWSYLGNRLYFVRLPHVSDHVQTGICFIDITKPHEGVTALDSRYPYIHMAPNFDDSLIICDTYQHCGNGKFESDLILFEEKSKNTKLLAHVPISRNHPGHAHPAFTPDGKRILFVYEDSVRGTVRVGEMDIQRSEL